MNSVVVVLGVRRARGASVGLADKKREANSASSSERDHPSVAVNALARHQSTVLRSDRVDLRACAVGEARIDGPSAPPQNLVRNRIPLTTLSGRQTLTITRDGALPGSISRAVLEAYPTQTSTKALDLVERKMAVHGLCD
jgi:hypothetical protein